MEKIGVFCSAASNQPAHFIEAAHEFGEWLGKNGKTLVYGGSHLGLMGVMGKACKENGGRLFGMVPRFLEEMDGVEPDLDVVFPCEGLLDRKDMMLLNCEVVVAFPGGIGTLDEVFCAMGLNTVGQDDKKVIFLNIDSFWQKLLDFLGDLKERGFLRHELSHYFLVANSVDELTELLNS